MRCFLALVIFTALAATASAADKPPVIPAIEPPAKAPFALTDHIGKRISDADFRGRYLLVYFGYTFCPDICPTGLQAMAEALDLLGPAGRRVQPLFITVDPARDTTEVLADYVDAFHPRLIGLTGTAAEVKAVAAAYRVRYFKLFYPWSGEEKDEKGKAIPEYAMYHTAFTYLMGPDGSGLAVFPHGAFPEDMAAEIRRALEAKI